MSRRNSGAVGLTLATGLAGGFLAQLLGVPAAALLGSSLAVAILAATTGFVAMPARLRDAGFALIGVALGGGIDADLASRLPGWALSLSLLTLSLVATLWLGMIALQRFSGFDRETAVLSSAPGTMSNVLALAIEGGDAGGKGGPDINAIMVLQVLRLLFLVLMVPPFAALLDVSPVAASDAPRLMGRASLLVLLVIGYGAGLLGARWGVPASCFLFGLLVSAGAHAGGLVVGAVPEWAMFLGLAIAGAALGMRMDGISLTSLRRLARAGVVMLVVALSVSMAFALVTAFLTGLPLAQVWIAFAPGGVEAMAAIGLALGYDPAFVALHHFARILMLVVLMPLAVGRVRGGTGQQTG